MTLATKKAFPSFCPRSEIAFTRVIEMSPMTSAAEMLRAQGQALMKAARQSNVNQEMLQRLLQGSLAAGVNGGVPMLMRAFFLSHTRAPITLYLRTWQMQTQALFLMMVVV